MILCFLLLSQLVNAHPMEQYQKFFEAHPEYHTDGFDFPVGKPDADGYYNAQDFQENYHLGEDWNGNGGGYATNTMGFTNPTPFIEANRPDE